MGKDVTVQLTGVEARTAVGRITASAKQVVRYLKNNPLLLAVLVLLTLGPPFLFPLLPLPYWKSVVVGILFNVVMDVIGFYAITRVHVETITLS